MSTLFRYNSMKRLVIVLVAMTVLVSRPVGLAQSAPSVSAARLHVSVAMDAGEVFVYRYTIENGAGSNAGVSRLGIDVSLPAGATTPSSAGLTNGTGYFATAAGSTRNPRVGLAAIPVGLSAPQPGWRTTVAAGATARWVAAQDGHSVAPKQRLAGFVLTSHGPPALRRYMLAPHVDREKAPVMEAGDDPGEIDRFEQDLEHYIESRSTSGTTLAPTALAKVTADAVLANLLNQVSQARSVRWIATDAAARNINDKLQAARAALSKGQSDIAANALGALRAEVAAQSGKALTTEAVALLDLNIRYSLPLVATP
jgi:hypothetical protein